MFLDSLWTSVTGLNVQQVHSVKTYPLGSWHVSESQHSCTSCCTLLALGKFADALSFLSSLQAYLTDFLCQFAQQPCYIMFSCHLNDTERRVLQTIGI